jgi:hypothetical protein
VILLDEVAETLDAAGTPFALIGAAALAVHGVVRSTFNYDLLTTSTQVLDTAFWSGIDRIVLVDGRAGDEDDPFAAVVRLSAAGERDVDLMIGRPGWLDGVIARRIGIPLVGRDIPSVTAGDLILLKLYAGGTQDRWDIEQLLAAMPDAKLREDVESRLSDLPQYSGVLWQRIIALDV